MDVALGLGWWRCPDGVELYEAGERQKKSMFVRVKSDSVEPLHLENENFRDSLVLKFASAVSESGLLRFLSEYGFPTKTLYEVNSRALRGEGLAVYGDLPSHRLFAIRKQQREMDALLRSANDAPEEIFNQAISIPRAHWDDISGGASLSASMVRSDADGSLGLMLNPTSLYDLMKMEAALIMCGHAELQTCPLCSNFFVMGGEKAKRTDSKYCTPNCRLKAYRAKKKK